MKKTDFRQQYVLVAVIIAIVIIVFTFDPIRQDQQYHNFVDQRTLLGIPNFFNVFSNILFGIVASIGIFFLKKDKRIIAPWSWRVFFFAILTVCFSSGYYHWDPRDATLVWDRLSMSAIFMSLTAAVLSEVVDSRWGRKLLIPFLLAGMISVIYWHISQDLRLYVWVQLIPIVIIPVILILNSRMFIQYKYVLITFLFYLCAKLVELYDKEIFQLSGRILSGHSLKHILAAIGLYYILKMLKKQDLHNSNMQRKSIT